MRQISALLLIVAAASACLPLLPPRDPQVLANLVNNVVVDPNTVTMAPDTSRQLTALAKDAQGRTVAGVSFTWTSSSATFTVDPNNGTVTSAKGASNGSGAQITACATLKSNACGYANVSIDTGNALRAPSGPHRWEGDGYVVTLSEAADGWRLSATWDDDGQVADYLVPTRDAIVFGEVRDAGVHLVGCASERAHEVWVDLVSGEERLADAPDSVFARFCPTGDAR
jgi:hypothetical protein